MKRLLVTLQILACYSLAAQDQGLHSSSEMKMESQATSSREMNPSNSCKTPCPPDPCKKECPKDPCPCFQRGDDPIEGMPMTCKYPAAYNHPANTKVEDCWDVYADASYIYWYTGQNGYDLATTALNFADDRTFPSNQGGFTVFQNFNYTSGFKVGLGCNLNIDDWVADVEYTYLRQTTSTSNTAPASTFTTTANTGVFKFSNWFTQQYYGYGVVAQNFTSKWKFGLDWIDLTFKRPFYQGRKLIVTPSAGLRASLIRQNLKLTSPNAFLGYDGTPAATVSKNHSNSWAIGPRALLDARWLIGAGFRFQGNMGASLLFTRFTSVKHKETGSLLGATTYPVAFSLRNYDCLRPMAEANLGMGWGTYFSQNSYHLDFSATYDFNYLWGQNMLRYLVDINSVANTGTAQDMFLHGLTIKARFDF